MCCKRLSSPRCRSELDSACVVLVPGQKCIYIKKIIVPIVIPIVIVVIVIVIVCDQSHYHQQHVHNYHFDILRDMNHLVHLYDNI